MILLTTLNARYQHSSFGLRYLYANLAELKPRARIMEFTIQQNPRDIVERVLEAIEGGSGPVVVGFGVYIWNTRETLDVVSALKRVRPDVIVVLGGPEISFETEGQELAQLADHVICGEADFLFRDFCRHIFATGQRPAEKIIRGELPEIKAIELPYAEYSDEDIRNRVIYVEASRGCPYKCEYCLSSLDKSVRNFETERFLGEMDRLIQRGARQFKFVDRTFNLSVSISTRILEFFLDRVGLGLFLHFEMVPDRLPNELKALIEKFPAGSLQFEIGVQTWSKEVAARISRRQDYTKIRENLTYLKSQTGVHMHVDLIAGLPGETLESFGQGFDALSALEPHEIQLGLLKRLKGTPIVRHDQEWKMVYQTHPPFQILCTQTLSFETMQRLGRLSKFWDLIANSGNFGETFQLIRSHALAEKRSFFEAFLRFSDALSLKHPQQHSIALPNLVRSVWEILTQDWGWDLGVVRKALVQDYALGATRRDVPTFLRDELQEAEPAVLGGAAEKSSLPRRQKRHLPCIAQAQGGSHERTRNS